MPAPRGVPPTDSDPGTVARAAEGQEWTDPSPPRCRRCAYVLTGLPSPGRCPECSEDFDLADPATFTRRPPFLAWKFWLPGLAWSVGVGLALMAVLTVLLGNWGASLFVVVPFSASAILGYRFRAGNWLMTVCALVMGLMLFLGLLSAQVAGVFCGMVLGMICIAPIALGAGLGVVVRTVLKKSGFSQRSYLPIVVFAATPIISAVVEGPPGGSPIEAVTTETTLAAGPGQAWRSMVFYEEVEHEPPLLLRIGLAHPLRAIGRAETVGDIKTCIYNKGRITKRVTAAEPARLLAFDVIQQQIGYEHDVRLIRGSFEFEGLADGTTRVRLTTVYQPLIGPRFAWRWGEAYAVHLLHGHVLEGMRRRAESSTHASATEGVP